MLPVSGNVNAQPRKISCKLETGGNTITNIKRLTYASGWSGDLTVGQAISSYISVNVPMPNFSIAGANVTLIMGIGTTVEWVQIGSFRVKEETVRIKQGYVSFQAYDKLYYAINTYHSTGNKTLQTICNEVCSAIGITSTTLAANPTIDSSILDGYTMRDVLGFIAGYQGKNAYLSPSGVLELRWFTSTGYTADGTRANIPPVGESDCTLGRWICQTQEGVIDSGSGQGIYFTCPFMTQARLDTLRQNQSLTYRKAEVDIPYGNFCLQSGDIITVSTTGSNLTVPIMDNSWTYDGGLSSAVASNGVSDYSGTANNAEFSVSARRVRSILEEHKAANRVTEAIQEATDTITGAMGGVMRINMGANGKPAELLILETGDISITPQRVFRLNENGLGYSANGYGGPYETAITANGLIVTDRFVGNTISGVTLETTQQGSGSRSQTVTENGSYELNRIATDDTVHFVGRLAYIPRGNFDELDSIAIRTQQGNAVTIGYENVGVTNDEFIYYSDLSAAPSGAEKFNFYAGHMRIYSSYEGDMITLQDKLHELENRIEVLEQALDNGQ